MRNKFIDEIPTYYLMLVEYLAKYIDKHETALSIVQVDTNDCFYRVMISIPHVVEIFNKICLPIYFIDGTFYRCAYYDGVIIQLSAKIGNGGIIQLCAAWVPCENTMNYVFFFIGYEIDWV